MPKMKQAIARRHSPELSPREDVAEFTFKPDYKAPTLLINGRELKEEEAQKLKNGMMIIPISQKQRYHKHAFEIETLQALKKLGVRIALFVQADLLQLPTEMMYMCALYLKDTTQMLAELNLKNGEIINEHHLEILFNKITGNQKLIATDELLLRLTKDLPEEDIKELGLTEGAAIDQLFLQRYLAKKGVEVGEVIDGNVSLTFLDILEDIFERYEFDENKQKTTYQKALKKIKNDSKEYLNGLPKKGVPGLKQCIADTPGLVDDNFHVVISTWSDWINHPRYKEFRNNVQFLFENDKSFREQIIATIKSKKTRRGRSEIPFSIQMANSTEYILEETAVQELTIWIANELAIQNAALSEKNEIVSEDLNEKENIPSSSSLGLLPEQIANEIAIGEPNEKNEVATEELNKEINIESFSLSKLFPKQIALALKDYHSPNNPFHVLGTVYPRDMNEPMRMHQAQCAVDYPSANIDLYEIYLPSDRFEEAKRNAKAKAAQAASEGSSSRPEQDTSPRSPVEPLAYRKESISSSDSGEDREERNERSQEFFALNHEINKEQEEDNENISMIRQTPFSSAPNYSPEVERDNLLVATKQELGEPSCSPPDIAKEMQNPLKGISPTEIERFFYQDQKKSVSVEGPSGILGRIGEKDSPTYTGVMRLYSVFTSEGLPPAEVSASIKIPGSTEAVVVTVQPYLQQHSPRLAYSNNMEPEEKKLGRKSLHQRNDSDSGSDSEGGSPSSNNSPRLDPPSPPVPLKKTPSENNYFNGSGSGSDSEGISPSSSPSHSNPPSPPIAAKKTPSENNYLNYKPGEAVNPGAVGVFKEAASPPPDNDSAPKLPSWCTIL